MKKILFLVLILFLSTNVFADCAGSDDSKCPKTVCPFGTFMGDDGKCYDCKTDESVEVTCIGYEKAFEVCPNRFFEWTCGLYSKLKCFDEKLIKEIIEDDGRKKEVLLRDGDRYQVDYTTHECVQPDVMY